MAHTFNILENEPMNVLGWPLFLPVCIAKHYNEVWTEERIHKIILAAKAKGQKFTFGSDTRNNNAGRLTFCKRIAKKCNLKKENTLILAKEAVWALAKYGLKTKMEQE